MLLKVAGNVDILTAISEDSENKYDVTLYFNKKWEPVKIYMDFMNQVVADSEKDGLAVVMEKAIFEQEYKEKEYTQLKEYTDLLENVSTDLRKFKHDYINILLTLGGYIDEGDLNGLKEFYNKEEILARKKGSCLSNCLKC